MEKLELERITKIGYGCAEFQFSQFTWFCWWVHLLIV